MLRSIIDHKKIFVTAMNGPAVGGGSAWFTGSSDILLVSSSTYLQVNFSSLGLVPEYGSAINFKESMGVHRANEVMMFGRRLTAEDLEQYGIANKIFPAESFQESVKNYLNEQLKLNDGKSMIEVKRLQNAPLRDSRLIAVVNAMDALAERFVEGAPMARFAEKKKLLEGTFFSLSTLLYGLLTTSLYSPIQEAGFENLDLVNQNHLYFYFYSSSASPGGSHLINAIDCPSPSDTTLRL
jgi:peroxisomal 3,2-trans-enoyl-CoA isomerase